MAELNADVKKAYEALSAKTRGHKLRWRYYDGDHPLAFTNLKMPEVFHNGVVFRDNLCQVVVNTTRDRLRIDAWSHEDEAISERIDDLWKKVLRKTATQIHVAALTTGESYLVIWPRKDNKGPVAYYHDPRQVHVIYEDDDPYTARVAAKTWIVGDEASGKKYLNLYYPDRIEHYAAGAQASTHGEFRPTEQPEEPNPYGRIPVFHFRLNPRVLTGELTIGAISIQDGVNKLLNDLMVASEYCAFPQRWAIGNWDNASKIPIGPGVVTQFSASARDDQPASVGTFQTSDPRNHLDPIETLINSMAYLTGTPKHYFSGQSGEVSGEALRAMEAPLVAKVEQYQEVLAETWAAAVAFALQIDGTAADAEDIEVIWAGAQTVQPQSQATTRETNTRAGIPIKNQLRDEGWTEEQLEQLDEDRAEEATATAKAAAPPKAPPQTPEQAQPAFTGILRTPDLAGQLAETGALSRAVNRARNGGAAK